jgi:hypothetical protein
VTTFKDRNEEERLTGPWFESHTPGGRLVAQVYDHGDGSCTIQIQDGRWQTLDFYTKLLVSKHYPTKDYVDLLAEVRAMGYEPESEDWGFTGHACWFDPEDYDGEPTESYGVVIHEREGK